MDWWENQWNIYPMLARVSYPRGFTGFNLQWDDPHRIQHSLECFEAISDQLGQLKPIPYTMTMYDNDVFLIVLAVILGVSIFRQIWRWNDFLSKKRFSWELRGWVQCLKSNLPVSFSFARHHEPDVSLFLSSHLQNMSEETTKCKLGNLWCYTKNATYSLFLRVQPKNIGHWSPIAVFCLALVVTRGLAIWSYVGVSEKQVMPFDCSEELFWQVNVTRNHWIFFESSHIFRDEPRWPTYVCSSTLGLTWL